MKNTNNKIIIAILFLTVFSLAGVIYAEGKNIEVGGDIKIQQQTQDLNQIQAQAQAQTQIKIQDKQQLQDGSEEGDQVKNQNQAQNQGEDNKVQNKEQEESQNQNESDAMQRRSQVANAVQGMLQVADRNEGIGQQVRVIAQNQTEVEVGLEKIQKRNSFTKFFIGANYSEINNVKKLLEQNKEQINQLNQAKDQLSNSGDQQILTEQIQNLEQYNVMIEASLETNQKSFSLFGWLAKMF